MLSVLISSALAQPTAARAGTLEEPVRHEVGVRYRFLNVPDNVADWWLHGPDDNPELPPRPHVAATGVGIDYRIGKGVNAGVFYVEWLKALVTEGYFDDREDPPDFYDGDYIVPVNFGAVNLGAVYEANFQVVETERLTVEPLLGFGLGVAILTGRLENWDGQIDETTGDLIAPWDWYAMNPDDPDGVFEIPPALPLVDVVFGTRFVIDDHYAIRVEGGFHVMPNVGVTFGYQF